MQARGMWTACQLSQLVSQEFLIFDGKIRLLRENADTTLGDCSGVSCRNMVRTMYYVSSMRITSFKVRETRTDRNET